MDMSAAVSQHELDSVIERTSTDLITILVAPNGSELHSDGVLKYIPVVDVSNLIDVGEGSVLVFEERDQRLLQMFVQNCDLFGYSLKTLVGIPNVNYGQWWDTSTWQLERVSYPAFISELSIESQLAAEHAAANLTKHDRERAQVTRSDGTVKDHSAFDLVGVNTDEDVGDGTA
jgi:hypothetical protein